MGAQSTYFYQPDAKTIKANLPKDVEKWLEVFGRANAEAFTRHGWPFFVAERFDLFYPGYGDSWPALHGAIGMTYEAAGGPRGGTTVLRDDGTTLTLADRIQRHYTTAMTTLRTTSAHAQELLQYTFNAMRTQATSGQNTYLLPPTSPNFRPLLDMMQRQSIQIGTLTAGATLRATRVDSDAAESHTFPAGTAVISTHQPLGGLVQTLLEKSPTFSKGFLEEQRQKTQADESDDFYDLTSWSLPLAMNVETYVTASPVSDVQSYQAPAAAPFRAAPYGYAIDGNEANLYRIVGRFMAEEVKFSVGEDAMMIADRRFARGSLIVLKGNNKPDVDTTLE